MPIVFMLEKPTRKRLRCINRVACEGYVLYAQKPAQGGGYDCAIEGAGPLNAAGMAQAFMAAGIGEMLHNALHAEMEAGKRAARKARGKEKDGGNAATAATPHHRLRRSLPSRGSLGDGTGMKADEAPSSVSQSSTPSPQGEGLQVDAGSGKRLTAVPQGEGLGTQDADEAPLSALQGLGVQISEEEEEAGDAERADAGGAAGGEGAGGGADAARGQDAASGHA